MTVGWQDSGTTGWLMQRSGCTCRPRARPLAVLPAASSAPARSSGPRRSSPRSTASSPVGARRPPCLCSRCREPGIVLFPPAIAGPFGPMARIDGRGRRAGLAGSVRGRAFDRRVGGYGTRGVLQPTRLVAAVASARRTTAASSTATRRDGHVVRSLDEIAVSIAPAVETAEMSFDCVDGMTAVRDLD